MKIPLIGLFLSFLGMSSLVFAEEIALGNLRYGVTAPENEAGEGYLLYSEENIYTRFTAWLDQADHFMVVKWDGEKWIQFANEVPHEFTPRASDILVADLNFSTDSATVVSGSISRVHGITRGVRSTDLAVIPNQWNGVSNPAEFGLSGTTMTTFPKLPEWWFLEQRPVIIPTQDPKNNTVANVGQAKWFAFCALAALEENDQSGLAALVRDKIVGPNAIIPSFAPAAANSTSNYRPLRLGQLKAIAKPFYDEINQREAGPDWLKAQLTLVNGGELIVGRDYWVATGASGHVLGGVYPWNPQADKALNKSVASIGQLKRVFALSLEEIPADPGDSTFVDSDNDGVSDQLETQLGSDPNHPDNPAVGLVVYSPR